MRGIQKLGVALVALAVGVLGARASYALVDDPFTSYTQPANALVMPFDSTDGHVTFLIASNVTGTSSFDGVEIAGVTTHWSFWDESCDHLVDVSICLTLNDTIVVDPTRITAIDAANNPLGPETNLSGYRGFVTVTAYDTDETCAGFELGGFQLVDNALVGAWTLANTDTGSAFGNDAIGLGVDEFDNFTNLPDLRLSPDFSTGFLDILTFNPQTLEDSEVILIALAEGTGKVAEGIEIGPLSRLNVLGVSAEVGFFDNLEIFTSLPDIEWLCVLFTSVISSNTPTLIPPTTTVDSPGIVRLTDINVILPDLTTVPVGEEPEFNGHNWVYGIHGQAVGPFGASSNAKYLAFSDL